MQKCKQDFRFLRTNTNTTYTEYWLKFIKQGLYYLTSTCVILLVSSLKQLIILCNIMNKNKMTNFQDHDARVEK